MKTRTWVMVMLCGLLSSGGGHGWAREALVVEPGRRLFSKRLPADLPPAEGLEQAHALRERGRWRRAQRMYQRVAETWPYTRAGGAARYHRALVFEEQGRKTRAIQAYGAALEHGAGAVRHETLLERLYTLGKDLLDSRRRILGIPAGRSPERAVPAFEAVVRHGPLWEHTPRAQFLIGQAYEQHKDFEDALRAYRRAMLQFTHTPSGEESTFARVQLMTRMVRRQPQHRALVQEAWNAALFYLEMYPQGRFAGETRALQEELYERRATAAYEKARFYDRHRKNPRAAIITYRLFLEHFPQAAQAAAAEKRLQRLKSAQERDNGQTS